MCVRTWRVDAYMCVHVRADAYVCTCVCGRICACGRMACAHMCVHVRVEKMQDARADAYVCTCACGHGVCGRMHVCCLLVDARRQPVLGSTVAPAMAQAMAQALLGSKAVAQAIVQSMPRGNLAQAPVAQAIKERSICAPARSASSPASERRIFEHVTLRSFAALPVRVRIVIFVEEFGCTLPR